MQSVRIALRFGFCLVFSLALIGCSNPADQVPQAAVSEAGAPSLATERGASGDVLLFNGETSKISFVGSKIVGASHDGGFQRFEGTMHLDSETSEIEEIAVVIDMDSTWSDNNKLTGHLKNEDFFDVPKYPTSEFTTTEIKPINEGDATHQITGNLTLHGVTKSITFPARVDVSADHAAIHSDFSINRGDFDIVYGNVGNNAIRDAVVLKLDVHASRASTTTSREEVAAID